MNNGVDAPNAWNGTPSKIKTRDKICFRWTLFLCHYNMGVILQFDQ